MITLDSVKTIMKICTTALMQLDRPSTNNMLWKSAKTMISFHQPLNISRNNFNAVSDGLLIILKECSYQFWIRKCYYTYPVQKYDCYVNGCQIDSNSLFLRYKWPNFWCSSNYKTCPLKWPVYKVINNNFHGYRTAAANPVANFGSLVPRPPPFSIVHGSGPNANRRTKTGEAWEWG